MSIKKRREISTKKRRFDEMLTILELNMRFAIISLKMNIVSFTNLTVQGT